jgi:SAM-dependent methyltransferase
VDSVVGGMAPVWYRPVPTLLIRRRRPIGEPPRLEGAAGARRIVQAVLDLGIELDDVHQAVIDSDGSIADLDPLGVADAGGTFDLVLLGSHLVNNPDPERRLVFLALAARHLAPDGRLLVEHHPLDWAETAEPTPEGAMPGMVDVRRDPPFVSAVSVYEAGGRIVRQPFTARVLSEADLDAALGGAGLTRVARRGPTWLEARRRGLASPRRRELMLVGT